MALLKTDNFLIIFAILLIVLLISYVVLIIKTSNLNKRYKQFMKKLGNGKNIEEDLENYMYRVEKVERQNSELHLICKEMGNQLSGCVQKIGIVRYNAFKDTGSDLSFALALLDEDKIDFFRKYNITPLLSFDGIAEVQNKQRPGCGFNSFSTVLKNIPYYLLRFPEGMVRSTLTKDSISYLYESVKFLYNLGFKYMSFYPNTFEDWDDKTFLKYEKQLTLIGEWIYTKMPDAPHITNLEKAVYKVDNIDNLSIDNEVQRCGMGTISCSVTFDGKIIPCQEKLPNPNPNHIIGNIYEGINKAKVEEYIQWYLKQIQNIKCPEKCDNKIHLLCKSVACPSRLEDLNFKLSTSHCYSNIALYRLAMRLNYLCGHTYKGKFFKEGGSI